MHIGLRLFFAFAAITGLAAFFVLRVFVTEIKPSVREVMEDVMVDSANLLAEVAAPELAALPAGGTLGDGPFAGAVREYAAREVDVKIGVCRRRRWTCVSSSPTSPAAWSSTPARRRPWARTTRAGATCC